MKKIWLCVFTLLLIACMVSCSLFGQEELEESYSDSKSLVKVCFSQRATKSLSSAYSSGLSTKLYLNASPQFTRGTRTVVGTVEDQLISPDDNGDFDAGYFEQGKWDFTVDAYIENSDASVKTKVATQTISGFYISENNNVVSFELEDVAPEDGAKGNISVTIKVPKIASSSATLKVKIDGTDTAFKETPTQSSATDDDGSDLIKFVGSIEGVTAGCHDLTFLYYVENTEETDESKKNVLISSEIVSVRVVEGAELAISGTMMNEKYAKGNFSVVIVSESWTISLSPTDASIVQNEEKTLTCTAADTKTDDTITYQWYVDGAAISGATSSTYKFKTSSCGIFSITCSVKVNGVSKSTSTYVTVGEAED